MFLRQIANYVNITKNNILDITKEEWENTRPHADYVFVIVTKADKDSCIVVWDREDYLLETDKQLENRNIYRDTQWKIT